MKIVGAIGLVVGATVAVMGLAGPAFAGTAVTPAPRTVDSMKATHLTAKLTAMQTKLAAKPKLAGSMTTLQADITKALADTAAWRKQVDAATTKAGVLAADPAHQVVKADLVKLHTDLATAKTTAAAAH
jgi:hypothetical protein